MARPKHIDASPGDSPERDEPAEAVVRGHFHTALADAQPTSSEDEAPGTQKIRPEEASTVIGVSIGQEQTRLTSAKTPAVEKQAAIDEAGGFFEHTFADGTIDADLEEQDDGQDARYPEGHHATTGVRDGTTSVDNTTRRATSGRPRRKTQVRMPSPWRSGPKEFQRTEQSRSLLRDGLFFSRQRASSGPESTQESWQKSLLSSLPSIPKSFSLSTSFSSAPHDKDGETKRPSMSSFQWPIFSGEVVSMPKFAHQRSESSGYGEYTGRAVAEANPDDKNASVGDSSHRPQLQATRSRTSQLRRSNSDNSLAMQRTLSRVSSLGDDSRFENVSEQVNSRLKAIKDSWQDSNIRLPSISSISNFNVASLKPDFLRERSDSLTRGRNVKLESADVSSESLHREKPVDPMTRQPYASAKAAVSDTTSDRMSQHPYLHRAMDQLEGDVVILGGYRGSVLRSAEPPNRQVWVPIKVGLNLRKVDLEVGLDDDDDEKATEKIIPGGMLTHIGPVDVSRRLFKRLRSCEHAREGKLRVHDYGYDWRLNPSHLSKQLIGFLENLPCNKSPLPQERRGATVIAHSLGGLITRHAVNMRPELFKGVIYAGVPSTCVNILGPMRNGDEVLLSSRVLTAQVNFTIRTSFALLPLDGRCFFDKHTKEEYVIDFFDPKTWIDYRLSPCVARPLPLISLPPKSSGISGYVSSMANVLPSIPIPGRKGSLPRPKSPAHSPAGRTQNLTTGGGITDPAMHGSGMSSGDSATTNVATDVTRSGTDERAPDSDPSISVGTAVTIPREAAVAYLTRTLASVKQFKQELAFRPAHAAANLYPPIAVIYGKSTPTVYGAKVVGRDGIKYANAYDELAFASGDGVVLARAAMAPEGYTTARGGVVSSERGHVTLLGDLDAVGRCLNAVLVARERGVGGGARH